MKECRDGKQGNLCGNLEVFFLFFLLFSSSFPPRLFHLFHLRTSDVMPLFEVTECARLVLAFSGFLLLYNYDCSYYLSR